MVQFGWVDMELLRLLADGRFHSGDELGSRLGIGRSAVWKQIKKLEEQGLVVHSVKGKGYRLSSPLELLSEETILGAVDPEASEFLSGLEVYGVIDSTSEVAMVKAREGVESGYVCLSEQQTKGRGRRGRVWVSPFAKNLYLSCVWNFTQGAAALEGLSLATGVAVARALRKSGITVSLKWPNDIWVNKQKLGGVLLEMTGDPAGDCQVVLGIGLNVHMEPSDAKSIDQAWVSASAVNPDVSRNKLAADVIGETLIMLNSFQVNGFSPFWKEWESLDVFKGCSVQLETGDDQPVFGIEKGVDHTGALRLETDNGLKLVKGGEVSLRENS